MKNKKDVSYEKKAQVFIHASDKIDFKSKTENWNKGHYYYIKIKRSIHQEDTIIYIIYICIYTCVCIYAYTYTYNIGTTKYMKKILPELKRGIESNVIIVGGLNAPFQ